MLVRPGRLMGPGFTRPASVALDPLTLFAGGINGMWLDPSDDSTCFQDSAGTIPAGPGDPVGLILDKSGNDNHSSQSTTPAKPTRRTDGTLWWLEADGIDDYLEAPTCQGQSGGRITTAASVLYTLDKSTSYLIDSYWNSAYFHGRIYVGWNSPVLARTWIVGYTMLPDDLASFAAIAGEKYTLVSIGEKTEGVLHCNDGVYDSSGPSGSVGGLTGPDGRIFCRNGTNGEHHFLGGNLYGLLAIDADKTADLVGIKSYLNTVSGRA